MARIQRINPDKQAAQEKMAGDAHKPVDQAEQHLHGEQQAANEDKHFSNIHQGKHVETPMPADTISGGTSNVASDTTAPDQSTPQQTSADNDIDITDSTPNALPSNSALNAASEETLTSPSETTEDDHPSGITPQQVTRNAPDTNTSPDNEFVTNNPTPQKTFPDTTAETDAPLLEPSSTDENDTNEPLSFLAAPTLLVSTITGTEGANIPISITVSSNSVEVLDEVITVTISGVPDGSSFSAGIDNGNGSWIFTLNDLEGLTFTPPVGVETYSLTVVATAEGNGTSASANDSFNVNVSAGGETASLTPNNDVYTSTAYSDTLYALSGDDRVYGGSGDDTIYGEGGTDQLYGQAGDDTLHGGAGDDRLYGGDGNDTLIGGAGTDRLYGEGGDDIFNVTGSNDVNNIYSGGSGYDTIQNVGNADLQFKTFNKNWSIEAINAAGHDITGTVDANSLDFRNTSLSNVDEIKGLGGNDTIRGSESDDTILGGTGSDRLYGYGGNDTIDGESGNDYLYGGTGTDTLTGGSGNDRLYGEAGSDTLSGGEGNDQLHGGDDADTLSGGAGNDRLYGGAGNDTITGGAGTDKYYGHTGDDTFNVTGSNDVNSSYSGGDGYDTIQNIGAEDLQFKTFSKNWSIEEINAGGYNIDATSANNSLDFRNTTLTDVNEIHGLGGKDTIRGSAGDDIIFGDEGNDKLYGYGGDDTLHGGSGTDRLYGGEGNDTLTGGAGNNDRLYGEAGDDIFIFNPGDGNDRAYGGSGWEDTIKLGDVTQAPNTGSGPGSWTLAVNGGSSYTLDAENNTIIFDHPDANGTITLDDGSTLKFQDIEKIEW